MSLNVLDRLEEHLDHQPEPDRSEPWSITGLKEAAWAARKAKAAHDSIATITAWEEEEIARVRAAADVERAREQSTLDFFTGALAQYLAKEIEAGRSTKTLNLPSGRVSIRARQPSLAIDDAPALEWARSHAPQVVKVRESLDRAAFKKAVTLADGGAVITSDGEVLEFARWEPQSDSASFTPASEPDRDA